MAFAFGITGFLGSLTTFSGLFSGDGGFDAGATLGHGVDGNLSHVSVRLV